VDGSSTEKLPKDQVSKSFSKMPLHQFDYLLVVGTIFAFLDAWNIGKMTYL
jgi:hypothetical protein